MAYDILNTVRVMESHLRSSGLFDSVQIGEPKDPPMSGFTAAIFNQSARIAELMLSYPVEVHTINIRIYRNMLAEPEENIELECSRFITSIMDDVLSAYTMGDEVRAVDFGGIYGETPNVQWGYGDVGGRMYRIADITLPLIVDAAGNFAPGEAFAAGFGGGFA